MTLTLAPVCATASATEPKTGTETPPSKSTVVPALRGLTPPTMSVPDVSMRCVCFMPSDPVMPWTMTFESALRKIAMVRRSLFCGSGSVGGGTGGELGGAARGAVHRRLDRHQRVVALLEDPAALFDVVAVEAHDERAVLLVTERVERAH